VLSIEATFDEVYRALLDKALIISISQGTTIFLVSFFIFYITHQLVTRHLTALAGFLGKYDLRQPPPPLRLQRRAPKDKDELDQVIAAFEIMRQSLERAYNDLRESEQRFRDYAETASDWFWATGPEHDFTYFSAQAGFDTDWGKLIGKRRWDIAADVASEPEHWREHMATLEHREPFHDFVYTVRRVNGALGFVSISGKPVFDAAGRFAGYRGVARDITERKRAEEALSVAQAELAHVSRVMTMGEMTASIAHEVNQPLAAIVANGDACLNWLGRTPPDLEKARAAVEQIILAAKRGGEVIGRIRALVKKTKAQKTSLDISEVAEEVAALVHGEARKHGVSLRTELAPALPPIEGDRVQLQQVILNLLMNGIEASEGVKDRPRELMIRSQLYSSDSVLLAVQDAGVGFDPDQMPRLFDAFFTTKPGGMGMGLSISRSIIEAHRGRLWASRNAGPGATFQFVLPARSRPAA